ncbi:hypothetical protein JCM10212_006436 [Sporobolomyces blumeae]
MLERRQWNGLEEMMQRQRETGGESLLHLIGGGGGGRSQQPTTTTSTRAEEPTETGPDKRDTKKKTARRSRIGTTDDRERRPESDLVDDRTTRTTRTKSGSPVKNGAGLLELERESPSKKKKKKRTRTEGDVNGEGKDVAMVEQETIEGHDAAGAGGTRASSAGRSVLKQRSRAPRAAVASKATTLRTMTTEEHDRGPRCGTTDARDIDGPGPSAIVVPRSMDRPALSTEVATDASPTRTSRKRGAEENKGSLCQDVDGGGQDEVEAPVKKKKKKLNSKRSVPLEISSPHPRQIASAPDEPICPPLVPIPCGTTDAKPGPRTKKKISIHSERIKSTDSSGAKPNVFDVVVGRVREVFASLTNERVAQSKEEEEDEDDDDLDLLKDYVAEVRIATLRRSAEVSDYSALQKRLATAKAKSKELRGAIDEEQRRRG